MKFSLRYLLIGTLFFSLSFPLYALAPWSKVENEKFRKDFRQAMEYLKKGDYKSAAILLDIPEEHLSSIVSESDFAVLTLDFPPFKTSPPKTQGNLEVREEEFLRRTFIYPVLDPVEQERFKKHILERVEQAKPIIDRVLNWIELNAKARPGQMSCSQIKGIFIVGSWLWYGLYPGEIFDKKPSDLDLFFVVDGPVKDPAIGIRVDTTAVDIHRVREEDFLEPRGNGIFLKLIAYEGIQIEGPLYFEGQKASPQHLFVLTNNCIKRFIEGMEVGGEWSQKAILRLKKAEDILNYLMWSYGKEKVNFEPVWNLLKRGNVTKEELSDIVSFLLKVFLSAKESIKESIIERKIKNLVDVSC